MPAVTRAAREEIQARAGAATHNEFVRFNGLPRMLDWAGGDVDIDAGQ